MRPPPTTLEIVETLALGQPGRPAVREGTRELSYGQFHAMLANCAAELHRLGVRPGQRVAVSGPEFALQLVLLIAAEGLGAVTASFQAEGDPDAPFLFTLVDWVFSTRRQETPDGVRFQPMDAAFLQALQPPARPGQRPWCALEPARPQRISRTSGSSGRSRFMLMSRQAQESWIRSGLDVAPYGPATRLLVLGPLVINAAFTRASRCLRSGGLVMVGPGAQVADLAPTNVWGLPVQLEAFLASVPAGYRAAHPVEVATVGGVVTPALRQRTAQVLGGAIANRYGSNEVGPVCDDLDAGGTGLLSAGVEVRILGPDGRELPEGESGVIAVRTPAMADGYLGLPEETAAAFRDGWFVSADVGALVGPRLLRLAGRQDDLVNIAGIKLPARQVEELVRQLPQVADCAVLAVNLQAGAVTLGVALVLAPGTEAAAAASAVQQALQDAVGGVQARLLLLDGLPVLHTGKIDRLQLQTLFQQAG